MKFHFVRTKTRERKSIIATVRICAVMVYYHCGAAGHSILPRSTSRQERVQPSRRERRDREQEADGGTTRSKTSPAGDPAAIRSSGGFSLMAPARQDTEMLATRQKATR